MKGDKGTINSCCKVKQGTTAVRGCLFMAAALTPAVSCGNGLSTGWRGLRRINFNSFQSKSSIGKANES